MAFTYTEGSTSDRDRLRLEIQDTVIDRALFSDAELDDFLAQDVQVLLAAAHACDTLATRFARDYDFIADGASFKKSTISKSYADQATRLRRRATGSGSIVVPRRVDGYSQEIESDQVAGANTIT